MKLYKTLAFYSVILLEKQQNVVKCFQACIQMISLQIRQNGQLVEMKLHLVIGANFTLQETKILLYTFCSAVEDFVGQKDVHWIHILFAKEAVSYYIKKFGMC